MADQPIWWRCLACNRRFCVGEEKTSTLESQGAKHCPFCGSERIHHGSETHPPMPGRWR
jgi:hypothetical protein